MHTLSNSTYVCNVCNCFVFVCVLSNNMFCLSLCCFNSFLFNISLLQLQLDKIVGKDCLLCGDMAIDLIEVAFIEKDQLPEYIESWTHGNINVDNVPETERFGENEHAPIDLMTFI
eukprot:m.112975 g.112975  ORF g.112975 m.112975 type:complete len:116 (+) comp12794_c0_seq1:1-348(+)